MIKVIIADDSAFLRMVLKKNLEATGKFTVLASAKHGKEAVEYVKKYAPDILILDCQMPVMDGLDALKIIMNEHPLPVFIFSSLTLEGADIIIRALECGAVDFLLKPSGEKDFLEETIRSMVSKLIFIVMKHRLLPVSQQAKIRTNKRKYLEKTLPVSHIDVVGMGASAGGVVAGIDVLTTFPADMLPVLWVQHMPGTFTRRFAERLDGLSRMHVKEAEDGDKIERGVCYVAPGGGQMRVHKVGKFARIVITKEEKVSGHAPSCDVLFHSLAAYYGQRVMGVILSGMGQDGANGLLEMHQKGAFVVGQNMESCVVYGMPHAARRLGAVDIEADSRTIGSIVMKKVGVTLSPEPSVS